MLTQFHVGIGTRTVAFTTNGAHLVGGGDSVQVWRVKDGNRTATSETMGINCVSVSKDGRWIGGGTNNGKVILWDATTHEKVKVFALASERIELDFSPDSTRFVAASPDPAIPVSIWEIAWSKRGRTFDHQGWMVGVKYTPQGDRIATATDKSIRVWDSNDGRLLSHIPMRSLDHSPLWFGDGHLLVVSDRKIKQVDTSSGSTISEWPVNDNSYVPMCLSLPKHEEFVAYVADKTVTFWDTTTHTQLPAIIQHPRHIHSIAISPDDQLLAICGKDGKVAIHSLSRVTNAIPLSRLHPTFQEPDIQIDDAVLDAWRHGQLETAEASLTATIVASQSRSSHVFASRALVRARLRRWDDALADAKTAIDVQPSVIGYIAKSIAHVGKGERHKGYRACDIAFERFHASHVTFLLMTKAILVFMAGEHPDAISRMDDMIAEVQHNSICYVVQAYMSLLDGKSQMESSDYAGAIKSFEHAHAQARHHTSQPLSVISLISGWKFDNIEVRIGRHLCDALYAADRIHDAVERFHQMTNEPGEEANLLDEHLEWVFDFRQRSSTRLEHLGDAAVDVRRYDEAVIHYTAVLSLNTPSPPGVLIKRGKVYIEIESWQLALDDANQVIALDPSSPWGYEMKHAALHKTGDFDGAVDAFEAMISKMAQSPHPEVQQRADRYISPSSTRATIRGIVQRTVRVLPRVLIDTTTGRLRGKAEQASAFEGLPIFKELVSSTTTRIDYVRIKREVRRYFRYVMFSHRWEDDEPLFQQVVHVAVYDLASSPTHEKLQMFCKIVRDAGFDWAWSDTCCIDKSDHFVLQEALVAMFRWYQGSALVVIFLRGVRSSSERGALAQSVWNTRAWTLQEYIAAKVIRFYTEDWTIYRDLGLSNHKDAPEIILEMEQSTGALAEGLVALRPGFSNIREKLRLASTRQATLVEDVAYALLGIFSVTGMPAIYGEGTGALGRLLAHVLAGSGDVSILAWTGESGSFNSCLPAHITVFNEPPSSHLPLPIPDADIDRIAAASRTSFDLDAALRLFDRLNALDVPWFAANRMKLSCIAFPLPPFWRCGIRVYRTDTTAFGTIEIRTRHDLSRMASLYLVHPWLDALLERQGRSTGVVVEDDAPLSPENTDEEVLDGGYVDDFGSSSPPESEPEPSARPALPRTAPVEMQMERERRARRLVAYLGRPFGALLFAPASTMGGRDYRRVAADGLIAVQFQENVSLSDVLDNIRTLDVL